MTFTNVLFVIVLPMLTLAVVLSLLRLLRGPSMPDRVVALDLITTLGLVIIVVFAMATNQPIFLDVAIVLALIAFLGTVAFASYVERRS